MNLKMLLYCTKKPPYLSFYRGCCRDEYILDNKKRGCILNGKIVAECDFEVEEICCLINGFTGEIIDYSSDKLKDIELFKHSCLKFEDIEAYLGKKGGYAIHIKNLHIFDEPRDLDFYSSKYEYFKPVKKAPQNMCKVWEDQENPFVFISVRSEWLCKELNREKTIEVRKVVLKEMLE